MIKVIILDVDGVVNSRETLSRDRFGFIGIDPYLALLVHRICEATGAKIVVSSTWRLHKDTYDEVKDKFLGLVIDRTPQIFYDCATGERVENPSIPYKTGPRGHEIKDWLDRHPEVTRYAILDDDSDMLPEQLPNFFKTTFETGLTEEIAAAVTEHLSHGIPEPGDVPSPEK